MRAIIVGLLIGIASLSASDANCQDRKQDELPAPIYTGMALDTMHFPKTALAAQAYLRDFRTRVQKDFPVRAGMSREEVRELAERSEAADSKGNLVFSPNMLTKPFFVGGEEHFWAELNFEKGKIKSIYLTPGNAESIVPASILFDGQGPQSSAPWASDEWVLQANSHGRQLRTYIDDGCASISPGIDDPIVNFDGGKIVVEKKRIVLNNQPPVEIPAGTKIIEVYYSDGKLRVEADGTAILSITRMPAKAEKPPRKGVPQRC
jgi:hypothetical protein